MKQATKQSSFNPGLLYKFLKLLHENLRMLVYWAIAIAIAFIGAPLWAIVLLGIGGALIGAYTSHEKAKFKRDHPEFY